MQIGLSIGNSFLRAAMVADGVPHVLSAGATSGFSSHLWTNGNRVSFGDEAMRESFNAPHFFFTGLLSELVASDIADSTRGGRRPIHLNGRDFGVSGLMTLLLRRGIRPLLIRSLIAGGAIKTPLEPLNVILALPSQIDTSGSTELLNCFAYAGFNVVAVVPDYVSAIYAYNLHTFRGATVLHVDVGERTRLSVLRVGDIGSDDRLVVDVIKALVTDEGAQTIAEFVRQHILYQFGSGHDALVPAELYAFEREVTRVVGELLSAIDTTFEFKGASIPLFLDREDDIIGESIPPFSLRSRVSPFLNRLTTRTKALLDDFGEPVDYLMFSGGGCHLPFVIPAVRRAALSAKVKEARWGYENVAAVGAALYGDVRGKDVLYELKEDERRLTELVDSVENDGGGWYTPQNAVEATRSSAERQSVPSTWRSLLIRATAPPELRVSIVAECEGSSPQVVTPEWSLKEGASLVARLGENLWSVNVSQESNYWLTVTAECDASVAGLDFGVDVADLVSEEPVFQFRSKQTHIPRGIRSLPIARVYWYARAREWRISPEVVTTAAPKLSERAQLARGTTAVSEQNASASVHNPIAAPAARAARSQPEHAVALKEEYASELRVHIGDKVVVPDGGFVIKAGPQDYLTLSVAAYVDPEDPRPTAVVTPTSAKSPSIQVGGGSGAHLSAKARDFRRLVISSLIGRSVAPGDLRLEVRDPTGRLLYWYRNDGLVVASGRMTLAEVYVRKGEWKLQVLMAAVEQQVVNTGDVLCAEYKAVDYQKTLPSYELGERCGLEPSSIGRLRLDFLGKLDAHLGLGVVWLNNGVWVDWKPQPEGAWTPGHALTILLDTNYVEMGSLAFVISGVQRLASVVFVNPVTNNAIAKYVINPTHVYREPCALVNVYQHRGEWRYRIDDEAASHG